MSPEANGKPCYDYQKRWTRHGVDRCKVSGNDGEDPWVHQYRWELFNAAMLIELIWIQR